MPNLTIHRKSHYVNYFRKVRLYLDGKFLYAIADGETNKFDVPPGEHALEAKIDWVSSNKISFDVKEGEQIKIELGSSVLSGYRGILFPILRFVLVVLAAYLSSLFNNDLIFWFTILLILSWYISEIGRRKGTSLIFYLTSGRKEFFYLLKIED